VSGLAETLREAEPGATISLHLYDGSEVAGSLLAVKGDWVDLDHERVALSDVKRIRIQYGTGRRESGSKSRNGVQPRAA
jgi:hypothetical protein